jgi:hypothetical protein
MSWTERAASLGEMRNMYTVLVEHGGKNSLGRPSHKWKDDVKIDLQIVYEYLGSIHLALNKIQWLSFVNTGLNLWVP